MKIEQLADFATMMAKLHPGADINVCYNTKQGRKIKLMRKEITGHHVAFFNNLSMKPTITFEVDSIKSSEEGKADKDKP
jgi:hypothetical protein